jgi:hypothetical protein
VESLQKQVEAKIATRHDAYVVAMSLVVAAENSISGVD